MTTTQDPWEDAQRQLERYVRERNEARAERDMANGRAESAELGCAIAYRRHPTQEEGDAHAYLANKGDVIEEAHVPMGDHHGHRCACGRWVWGGPTVCRGCTDAIAVKIAMEWKVECERLRARVAELEAASVVKLDGDTVHVGCAMRGCQALSAPARPGTEGEWADAAARVVAAAKAERERLARCPSGLPNEVIYERIGPECFGGTDDPEPDLTSERVRDLMREGEQVARDFRSRMRSEKGHHDE